MTLTIRPATIDDLPDIVECLKDSVLHSTYFTDPDKTRDIITT